VSKPPDIVGSETKANAEKKRFEESQRKRLADVIEFYYKAKKNLEPQAVDDLNVATLPAGKISILSVGMLLNALGTIGYHICCLHRTLLRSLAGLLNDCTVVQARRSASP